MFDIRFTKFAVFAAIATAATLGAQAPAATPAMKRAKSPISVQWLGHASFEIVSSGGTRILIDPWLGGNPSTPDSLKPVVRYSGATKPAAILVTHSHFDHSADAKAIAVASGAPVISAFEWVNTLGLPEAQALGGNVGGTMKIGDVTVHIVPAMHSSDPGGRPVGFVLEFADGRTLYDTGDTWLFGDMSLIQERYHPSILLLGVGGGPYTQDAVTAAFAVKKFFTPSVIVPMHYGTFPALNSLAQVEKAFGGDKRLNVLKVGEVRKF